MKRIVIAALVLALLLCAAAFAEEISWTAETLEWEVEVWVTPAEFGEPLGTIESPGTRLEVADSAEGADGRVWYRILLPTEDNVTGWIRGDLVNISRKQTGLPDSPCIRSRDETYADSRDEAYSLVAQRYAEGMAHYAGMQEEDNSYMAEWGDWAGNSPIYLLNIDVTGDWEPEMLFVATPEETEAEDFTDIADLYIYTWKGDHAEQILCVKEIFVIAGDGPWYEVFVDMEKPGVLYVNCGCNSPGEQMRFELNGDGQFVETAWISAYCDYEAETDEFNDGYT